MKRDNEEYHYIELIQFYTHEIDFHKEQITELEGLLSTIGSSKTPRYQDFDAGGIPDWFGVGDAIAIIKDEN